MHSPLTTEEQISELAKAYLVYGGPHVCDICKVADIVIGWVLIHRAPKDEMLIVCQPCFFDYLLRMKDKQIEKAKILGRSKSITNRQG